MHVAIILGYIDHFQLFIVDCTTTYKSYIQSLLHIHPHLLSTLCTIAKRRLATFRHPASYRLQPPPANIQITKMDSQLQTFAGKSAQLKIILSTSYTIHTNYTIYTVNHKVANVLYIKYLNSIIYKCNLNYVSSRALSQLASYSQIVAN